MDPREHGGRCGAGEGARNHSKVAAKSRDEIVAGAGAGLDLRDVRGGRRQRRGEEEEDERDWMDEDGTSEVGLESLIEGGRPGKE